MRSMGTRRAALFAGAASVAAVALLAGCSAGQVAETALKKPSTYGTNADNSDASVAIRGLAVTYAGPKGFPAGGSAPLELGLYNQTRQPIIVAIGSRPPADAGPTAGLISADSVGLVGGTPTASAVPSGIPADVEPSGSREVAQPNTTESVEPTGSASAEASAEASTEPTAAPTTAAPAVQPARITIPPLSSVTFLPGDTETLQVVGLSAALVPGTSVNLVFEFSNGADPLILPAPVGVPMSPAPRGSAEVDGGLEEGH